MVTSKQLRLAIEMEEERRARLENDAANGLGWPWSRTKKTGEDGSYHTAQVALETEEERREKMEWI